jgi:hypothetical protein
MDPEDAIEQLKVAPGDAVTASLWNGMLELCANLVRSFGVVKKGSGIRIHTYPDGINIVADAQRTSYVGRFSVRTSGLSCTLSPGMVDGLAPNIGDKPIDGIKNGELGEIPTLSLDAGPNADLRSWVVIRAKVDPKAELPMLDKEDPEALQIEHTSDLDQELPPGVGQRVVAMLAWKDKGTISRVHQVLYFDQRLSASKLTDGRVKVRMEADA